MNEPHKSTFIEKAIVCGTSCACSCTGFMLAVLVQIPASSTLFGLVAIPEIVQTPLIVLLIFGTPIVVALVGISIGVKLITTEATT